MSLLLYFCVPAAVAKDALQSSLPACGDPFAAQFMALGEVLALSSLHEPLTLTPQDTRPAAWSRGTRDPPPSPPLSSSPLFKELATSHLRLPGIPFSNVLPFCLFVT